MTSDLPLVARQRELAAVIEAINSAADGRGQGIMITGEAGIGKTRLLREARAAAEERGLMVLTGRAVESGGAYRPLVEAFARPAARFAGHQDLSSLRPTLARVLPGWVSDSAVLAPMADPAAVLAGALTLLLHTMAPEGAALILDDLHWADPDTLSALTSLVESVDTLPLALILAARSETSQPPTLQQLAADQSIQLLPLQRLTAVEVTGALKDGRLPQLPGAQLDHLVTVIDGLPLIMDEFAHQILDDAPNAGQLPVNSTSLASTVYLRLGHLAPDCRSVLDALSVIGDTDAEVLLVATGMDPERLGAALHAALDSTLLIPARNSLGATWRHILIAEVVRDLLLPVEQQAIAHRAADQLAMAVMSSDGQLRQAGYLYKIAGHPDLAVHQLVKAARLAVTHAALDVAEQYLTEAQALTGDIPRSAHDVLLQRLETLILAGRSGDAYESGMAMLSGMSNIDAGQVLVTTARAAFAAGLYQEGQDLLARLDRLGRPADAQFAVLRTQAAYADRRAREAVESGCRAGLQAQQEGLHELACEALVIAGMAARRLDTDLAGSIFHQAIELSERHKIPIWEATANAELGWIDMLTGSDPTRLERARCLATSAGMVGEVAKIDHLIGLTELTRNGFVAAYPRILRADTQARQLHLTALRARTYCHLVEAYLLSDQPLPGSRHPLTAAEVEAVVAEGAELSAKVGAWGYRSAMGARAWLHGDGSAAIQLIEEDDGHTHDEVKVSPWWGFAKLLRVLDGDHPDSAFDRAALTGHHVNRAARALAAAVCGLRAGQPADEALRQADYYIRDTPFWGHLLRTAAAPAAYQAGLDSAGGWLREANAYFDAAGERPLQRRVRQSIAEIGGKVPRMSASVPVHLARFGITARESEILLLVNAGQSNTQIAERLHISLRTVETHVRSMLQKTGAERRAQLPSAQQ